MEQEQSHRIQPQTLTGWLRWLLLRAIAIGLGLILALLLLEIGVRILLPPDLQMFSLAYLASPEVGWKFKSNLALKDFTDTEPPIDLMVTNSLGYRDSLDPTQITPEKKVIVLQGDSNVFGYGLKSEDTLSRQVETLLNQCAGSNAYSVINAGIPGYDLNQYLIQKEEILANYPVDSLVMIFNLNNDIGTTALEFTYGVTRPYFVGQDDALTWVNSRFSYPQRIYPIQFIPAYAAYQALLEPGNQKKEFIINPNNPLSHSHLYLETVIRLHQFCPVCSNLLIGRFSQDFTNRDQKMGAAFTPFGGYWIYLSPTPPPYSLHTPTIKALLKAWYESKPAPQQFVLIMPDKAAVVPELLTEYQQAADKLDLGSLQLRQPTTYLQTILTELNIPFIEPLNYLRRQPDPTKLFLKKDTHYNARGQKILAQLIAQKIRPDCDFGLSTLRPADVSPQHPQQVNLANQVELMGHDQNAAAFKPGETLKLTLYWRALAQMDQSYKTFIHLVDQKGQVIAQRDEIPRQWSLPTTLWDTGEVISDTYELTLPPQTAPGRYQIWAGMYSPETMERLNLVGTEQSTNPNAIHIGNFEIK